jgi:hypothetical protein
MQEPVQEPTQELMQEPGAKPVQEYVTGRASDEAAEMRPNHATGVG